MYSEKTCASGLVLNHARVDHLNADALRTINIMKVGPLLYNTGVKRRSMYGIDFLRSPRYNRQLYIENHNTF